MTKYLSRSLLLAQLVLGVAALNACQSTSDAPAPNEQTGKLQLHLVTRSTSGATYRLRDAAIIVQGPSSTIFIETENDPDQDVFTANVPVGDYTYFLQEGWRLERVDGGDAGAETVEAELASNNPGEFQVFRDSVTAVPLRFRVGGAIVGEGAFELSIEVDDRAAPGFCSADSECADGQTCCIAGFLGTCVELGDGAACPLPDLVVSRETAELSWGIDQQTFSADSCALAEECIDAPGTRRLLRFSTETDNLGDADLVLGDPTTTPGFEFSECHGHYHFEGYAEYQLLDTDGEVAARGHKQAFCLIDIVDTGVPGTAPEPRYHCGFQGLQHGWGDVYDSGLDCQWVDITDVPAGDYTLRIIVNPQRVVQESNYSNNTTEIPVTITEPGSEGPLTPCHQSGVGRNCGWQIADGFSSASCTPGETFTISCGCACQGDSMLRVCEGSEACLSDDALSQNDDSCGLCSETTVTCPDSGVYTLLEGPFTGGQPFTCDATITPGGAASTDAATHSPVGFDAVSAVAFKKKKLEQ
ncbi:MAG TPA: lysyl oxidase family protein [Polyangiaceae bacterium]|nr:lysyl oxidase family protein [Polyangiaceae bacterium]